MAIRYRYTKKIVTLNSTGILKESCEYSCRVILFHQAYLAAVTN